MASRAARRPGGSGGFALREDLGEGIHRKREGDGPGHPSLFEHVEAEAGDGRRGGEGLQFRDAAVAAYRGYSVGGCGAHGVGQAGCHDVLDAADHQVGGKRKLARERRRCVTGAAECAVDQAQDVLAFDRCDERGGADAKEAVGGEPRHFRAEVRIVGLHRPHRIDLRRRAAEQRLECIAQVAGHPVGGPAKRGNELRRCRAGAQQGRIVPGNGTFGDEGALGFHRGGNFRSYWTMKDLK